MRSNNPVDLSLFLLIARIGKTRGLKGEFFLRSFAEDPESLLSFTKFYTHETPGLQEISFQYIKTNSSKITAKLKGIDTIESIQDFGQKDVYILRSELPELGENEAYWFELEGMTVVNLEGISLGSVHAINNFGASDVLEIKSPNKDVDNILIPLSLIHI